MRLDEMYVCDATEGITRAKSCTSFWTLRHRARAIEHRYVTLDHAAKLFLTRASVVRHRSTVVDVFYQSRFIMRSMYREPEHLRHSGTLSRIYRDAVAAVVCDVFCFTPRPQFACHIFEA